MDKLLTRRAFLGTMGAGAAALAASSLLPTGAFAAPGRTVKGRFHPPAFGLGGVAMGNGFKTVSSDDEAEATVRAAWEQGVRYYDTSPFYGYGLSERRMGQALNDYRRSDYILSTKVGRIFTAADKPHSPSGNWVQPDSFDYRYDYGADATRRSIEDSLQRLGLSSIDIVFIHDLSPDNGDLKERWTEQFEVAAKGAMPTLTRMREEGIIKAWGLGVNTLPPILRTLEVADPDIFLAAAVNYQLMDHADGVNKLLPAVDKRDVSLVIGSPLAAGFLAGRDRYLYGSTIPAGYKEKRAKIQAIAEKHGTDLRTVALQFAAAPKQVSSIIPGARNPEQVTQNLASMKAKLPAALWAELKEAKLIEANAPVPA